MVYPTCSTKSEYLHILCKFVNLFLNRIYSLIWKRALLLFLVHSFILTPGKMGGYWRSGRGQTETEASCGVASEAPRGFQQAWHQPAPRGSHVWPTWLLQDNDSQGAGHREWAQLHSC